MTPRRWLKRVSWGPFDGGCGHLAKKKRDLTVMFWICWRVSRSLRWSNKVSPVGGPPCLCIDRNQGPCSFIALLFSYCPRNLQTPSCACCHKLCILTVFPPLCVLLLTGRGDKTCSVHSASTAVIRRGLYWGRRRVGRGKSDFPLFFFKFSSTNLTPSPLRQLKTDARGMTKHNKRIFSQSTSSESADEHFFIGY